MQLTISRNGIRLSVVMLIVHVGTQLRFGVRMCKAHQSDRAEVEEDTPTRRSRSRSRARPAKGDAMRDVDQEADDEDDEENGPSKVRTLLEEATDAADGRRQRKRASARSPGHTPRSNIQRSLARIEMLSSPGSEAEIKLLEAFMEWFAEGKADGVKEEHVRRRLARERLMTDQDVVRRLIEEAECEQAKGQRGLTRFINKWKKEVKEGSTPGENQESDWSFLTSPQSSADARQCPPPIPSSFTAPVPDPGGGRHEEKPVFAERSSDTPPPSAQEVKSKELRILPPGLYQPGDRKAGAGEATERTVEPVEQIAKALQSQTAELASLVRHQAEGGGSQPPGTLKGLGKQSEELVFLMRARGQYEVKVGEGEHGQALANGLIAAQVGAATRLRTAGFRQKMTQRLAIGLAGPFWGVHERHALSAADFIGYTDAELDQFASEARGAKGTSEQRPPVPTRFDEWVARVRRQTDVWCLVYGSEWRAVRTNALELLSEWHLSSPHRWPLAVVMDLWEELHWRCMEDFKDILRKLKKEVGRETMTLAELKFHALLPGPDGQAWLVMPSVFDLQRPGSWFQEEVLPRIERRQERLLWHLTWQGGQRRDRPQAQVPNAAAGGTNIDKLSLKNLWGPKLTTEEVNRAKERAPLDRSGNLLCWGNLCHIGCQAQSCQRSHDGLRGPFEALDPAVQMQLLKRGGLKRMKAETKESVVVKIKDLRTKVEKDKGDKIQDGKRRTTKAGQGQSNGESKTAEDQDDAGSKAGGMAEKTVRFWEPPEEFKVDYTEAEDVKDLVEGPPKDWGNEGMRPDKQHAGQQGQSAPEEAHRLVKEAQKLAGKPVLKRLEGASDDLYAWAAARVARDPALHYDQVLIEMATYGLGELAKEAADLLEEDRGPKAGSSRLTVQDAVWSGGGPGEGKLYLDGCEWKFLDYKEEVYMTEELAALHAEVARAGEGKASVRHPDLCGSCLQEAVWEVAWYGRGPTGCAKAQVGADTPCSRSCGQLG